MHACATDWLQVTAAMRLADGVLLAVDAAEGVMVVTERAVKQAVQEGLSIALVITKVRVLYMYMPQYSTAHTHVPLGNA